MLLCSCLQHKDQSGLQARQLAGAKVCSGHVKWLRASAASLKVHLAHTASNQLEFKKSNGAELGQSSSEVNNLTEGMDHPLNSTM